MKKWFKKNLATTILSILTIVFATTSATLYGGETSKKFETESKICKIDFSNLKGIIEEKEKKEDSKNVFDVSVSVSCEWKEGFPKDTEEEVKKEENTEEKENKDTEEKDTEEEVKKEENTEEKENKDTEEVKKEK